MNAALDRARLRQPERRPDLPATTGTVTGEQTRHGTPLVRLAWENGIAAWLPAADLEIISK